MIDAAFAAAVSRTALANVATEYPYKLDQVLGSDDALSAAARAASRLSWKLRLAFVRAHALDAGSIASASSAARACGRKPADTLKHRLTVDHVRGELATLSGPHRASFERPYGWGWLLKLAAELQSARSGRLDRRAAGIRHWRHWRKRSPIASSTFCRERLIRRVPVFTAIRRSHCCWHSTTAMACSTARCTS